MTLDLDDKKWISKAIIKGVVDGINQVMIPYSEEQEKRWKKEFGEVRGDISNLQNDVTNLQNNVSRVERKLDNVIDHQAEKLDNHEKRIAKLELTRL